MPSRLLRGMATIGGEAVHDDPDSELVAVLLALNAVFVVAHPQETRESPALRFLRNPATDLAGGGILRTVLIPGAPTGRLSSARPPSPRCRPSWRWRSRRPSREKARPRATRLTAWPGRRSA